MLLGPDDQRSLVRAVDRVVASHARRARVLPVLSASLAPEERARILEQVARKERVVARFATPRRRIDLPTWRELDAARRLVTTELGGALRTLYENKLDELELDVSILDAIGDSKRVRPLAARRYGNGQELFEGRPLVQWAIDLLDHVEDEREVRSIPAGGHGVSVVKLFERAVVAARLEAKVELEPRLTAAAATGDNTIFLAPRPFGPRETVRLVAHEVVGHAVAARNARRQELELFQVGTAGAFADQEGVALLLEEESGALDGSRLRTIAARVVATDRLHRGAEFTDTLAHLIEDHGFGAEMALAIVERAYRGGGVARDAGYLRGFFSVRRAVGRDPSLLTTLRAGRVSITSLHEAGPWLARDVEAAALAPVLAAVRTGLSFDAPRLTRAEVDALAPR